ncbi:unnamed protein product [Linum tenue]|uniref:Calmodulin-binding domain-containing protein n=1 Tax=Linum tenue TaxID=586396 RepID=A0AAV0GQ67_9ROSI|nr:unnamed protein product [Linum tenue]
MDPEKLEPGNATDSESSGQSSSCSSSRTPSSRMEFESIDSRRAKQKQQSTVSDDAAATSSPNYMKTTTSYVAKKSSSSNSQRSGGGSLTRRGSFTKPAKGLARLSSSKFRMRKSFRRSRRVNSVSDDADWCSSDSEASQKYSFFPLGGRTNGTKSVRTLVKVASLRIRRQSKSSVVKATCSSALKDSKADGSHSSNGSSSAAAGMKVCPYSYCSLHGHHHSSNDQAPSLKRFVSMRRRMLQPKKKTNNSSEKASPQSSYSKRPKRSNKKNQGDQTKKGDVISQSCELGQAANGSRQDSCDKVKSGPLETDISNICEGHNQPQAGSREIKDLVTSPSDKEQNAEMEGRHFADHKPDGAHLSSEKSMEKNNYMGLWGLIYQHMVSGTAVTDGDESQQPEKLGEQHVEKSSGMDQRADIEVDSHQDDAIKLVQEAFDNILLEIPDPLSDNQSVSSVDTASDELGDNKNNTSASMEQVQQEQRKLEAEISNDSQGDKAEAKVGNKSGQKRLNGWSNLKKIMLMKRFVKAMEKVKNYNYTHKPRGQSIEQDEEAAEMVNLRPQSIGQKKNSEEWMLDYAIQKVISTMAPAQKRKVALIVQAFETVAPQGETGSHAASSTPKTPVQISRDISTQKSHEQEEEKARFGILLRKVSTGSKENHDQDAGACTVKQHVHVPCPEPAVDELASETGDADLISAGHDDTGDLIRVERESDGHIGPIGENPDEPGYQITKTHQEELILDDSFDNGTSEEITHENGDTRTATAAESPVGKQQHMKLWYLIYNHMVSGTTEPLQENGEEAEEGTPSGKEESRSQLEAIRLVEEAIDEIPLPETQDDVPASINPHVEEASTGCNKDRLEELNSSKTEVKPSCEEDGKEKEQAKPPLRKSWSNLKKVILLKRFIKSLEKVNDSCLTSSARKVIMPREPQFLAMEHEKEAEKVRLRNQEVGGRKSGDEWMLDYALRQVVAQLTPMRRRKVELLVEAFETVTPIGN